MLSNWLTCSISHGITQSVDQPLKYVNYVISPNVTFTSGMISNIHSWFVQLFTSKLLHRCTYLHILFINIELSVLYFCLRRICFQSHLLNPTDNSFNFTDTFTKDM